MNWQHFIDLLPRDMAAGMVGSSRVQLVPAAIPGQLIGLEREPLEAWKVLENTTSLGRAERE